MYKKIGLLETNQKPKSDVKGGIIYILKALNTNATLYKLGKTTDLKNRLNTYNSGNANDVEPLFIIPVKDIDSVESCVKKACKKFQYRKYKEVYELDIELLKIIIDDCNDFINALARKIKNKIESKDVKMKISRMKQKKDTYFMYISKNDNENDIIEV